MITRLLIACNVLAFVWEVSVSGPGIVSFGGGDISRVLQAGALNPVAVLHDGEWWRIFTSAFLHGGLLHIAVNMFSLWILGRFVESVMGPVRMALIYFISLIASGLGVVYFSGPDAVTVGASGAIFGLFGALFAIGFRLGKPGMELVRANIGILVINLVISFTVPAISWQAHICGLVAGFIATLLIFVPRVRVAPMVLDARTGSALETEYQTPPDTPHARS